MSLAISFSASLMISRWASRLLPHRTNVDQDELDGLKAVNIWVKDQTMCLSLKSAALLNPGYRPAPSVPVCLAESSVSGEHKVCLPKY